MEPLPLSRRHPLHGRNLRHAALVVLHRHGEASIGEILEVLWANDFRLTGSRVEAGKRLSDALRHEVRRGRARRVGWGRYALGRVARSTRYRILRRWRQAEPARRDQAGEPVLEGRSADDRIGEIPWTVHDRHGHQLWLANDRSRWEIGHHVRGLVNATRRLEQLRHEPRSPRGRALALRLPELTRRRDYELDQICARSSGRAASRTRRLVALGPDAVMAASRPTPWIPKTHVA